MSRALIIAGVLLASAVVRAQDAEPAPEGPKLSVATNGYFDSRFTYQHIPLQGLLLPTRDVPTVGNLSETNIQLKLKFGDKAFGVADASFLFQKGGYFLDNSGPVRVGVPAHDVASLRSAAVISELYASYNFSEHANGTIGKKRIVWGSGLALNPTDLLNPPKDPTDPTFQRSGSWLGRLELPYEKFTVSFVGAAKVLRTYGGLPSAVLYEPLYATAESDAIRTASGLTAAYEPPDNYPHFAAAARLYWLVQNTDVNLFYFYTNGFNDVFTHKSRVGASASRVFGNWEVHFEGLLQQGSSKLFANHDCIQDPSALVGCVAQPSTIIGYSKLKSSTIYPKALVGARYTTANNGMISLEYYYNGDGYSDQEFTDYLSLVRLGQVAARSGHALPIPGQQQSDPGVPQKFSFDPLRRHYAFITVQEPQIRDDFTLSATLIMNLHDLSGTVAPQVSWSVREWLTLSLAGFVTIPGLNSLGAKVGPFDATVAGVPVSLPEKSFTEFGLSPSDWRVFASARAFY